MNIPDSFEAFQQLPFVQGCSEALAREWPPGSAAAEHTHPFTARGLVARGEMWLRIGDSAERHLRAGDTFELDMGTPHAERYGADGATIWVGRFR